ncbi:uncharacterized protein LOC110030460 isoform X2 [Phalaenopsis equestris]|uniref:uncharacterized protein LOC110030460 isoform X2 n=1 Tax=Phalaenopsis equestris TaxID=78828 RepID=UPI0009E40657|nr:uncharacterized protein LOC110030460 isoform X2 [Phalaenopsis equestris]
MSQLIPPSHLSIQPSFPPPTQLERRAIKCFLRRPTSTVSHYSPIFQKKSSRRLLISVKRQAVLLNHGEGFLCLYHYSLGTTTILPSTSSMSFVIYYPLKSFLGVQWDDGALCQNLFKKCEALAVTGLTEYGDEIDVVAPTDILKQIFKIPYSKAQLSVAVQRIGDTLILNAGPIVEEEEKLFRRQNNQSKCSNPSIFLNFAMHSVRAEACDCPPAHQPFSQKKPTSPSLPVNFGVTGDSYMSSTSGNTKSHILDHKNPNEGKKPSLSNNDNYFWDNKMNKQKIRSDSFKRTQIGEKPRGPIQDSEQHRRPGNNAFLRVLFWQFHNFRMLLGSDMLLFSNDKYLAVSLHLWDVTRQVTPLTWLEAWLDNIMANVPELAICYHQNGVVQGYELLKTDDIFLLKGVSEDGVPAFHPQVVQQNGLSVLRFLQENCKQDPGAYWLYKGSGEDVIQLFDLSVLPKNHPDDAHDKAPSSLSSLMQKGRRDTMFSLGILLYRIAHRLSFSKAPSNHTKCAKFFKKCLDFLCEQDHMVVRAYAHEQFARLILKCYEGLEITSENFRVDSEVRVNTLEEECSAFPFSMFGSPGQCTGLSEDDTAAKDRNTVTGASIDASLMLNIEEENSKNSENVFVYQAPVARGFSNTIASPQTNDSLDICQISTSPNLPKIVADPISSKLAAIQHVSQAIKSLRLKRQLQNAQGDFTDPGNRLNDRPTTVNLSLCVCGDVNCIEICDIREWLPKAKLDQKMWNLVLLLGESYLALGDAYKMDGQLHRALKVVELACLVYGSMPQHLDDARFISSMDSGESYQLKLKESDGIPIFLRDAQEGLNFKLFKEGYLSEHLSPAYLFWPKAWSLVGDVYVDYQRTKGKEVREGEDDRTSGSELLVSNEVAKEVMRLKKKLGQYMKNCSSCLLINCSCQNDRASSGNSASSSGNVLPAYSRKQNRKSTFRASFAHCGNINDTSSSCRSDYFSVSENEHCKNNSDIDKHVVSAKPSNASSTVLGIADTENTLDRTPSKQTVFTPLSITGASKVGNGGIFRFLQGPERDSVEYNFSTAIYCYNAAWKAMKGFHLCSAELTSVLKKKGWVSNELGRFRLDKKDLASAEIAFAEAIQAFKEVSDHTNIILIYCNLGHGRRSLAEELVSKLDELAKYDVFQNAYKKVITSAKLEYDKSLKHYGAAKMELDSVSGTCATSLYNEVHTQFAHTYLRLGMLLAKEGISDKVHSGTNKDYSVNLSTVDQQKKITSASDAFWEALSLYKSLGMLRKQEAAFAHFQLANFHRDNCLKLVDLEQKQFNFAKGENRHLKAKWYSSLADKHWKKALDFYGPMTHPAMYLNILLEQAALSIDLSYTFHSNAMLEAALLHLLDGRLIIGTNKDSEIDEDSQIKSKFWSKLQNLLKNMLSSSLSGGCNKTGGTSQPAPAVKVWDGVKLREMFRLSLKSTSFSQLHDMHRLWLS